VSHGEVSVHQRRTIRRFRRWNRVILTSTAYAVRAMVAGEPSGYASTAGTEFTDASQRAVIAAVSSFLQEIRMSTQIKKLNHKLDSLADKAKGGAEKLADKAKGGAEKLADKAKDGAGMLADKAVDGAEKLAGKIIDSANDVAHAAAEKARQQTKKAGGKLIEAGEKITKLAK
jgi:vacuolar-type H+-ATPase subunit H